MKILWNLLCQYNNIYAGSYKYLKEKKCTNGRLKKKKNVEATIPTVPLEQTEVALFEHWHFLPNKCHNMFTKHLFSIVVGYNFIFYYFILTYKKLTPQ